VVTGTPLFDTGPSLPPHPARFTPALLPIIAAYLEPDWSVLDPFAGTGGIHRLRALVPGLRTSGTEIEPRWAAAHPDTICADLFDVDYPPRSFDAIVTSPTYGNRMSDHHEARDTSRRLTYRHTYGEPLHPGNSGLLHWGKGYRDFHERAWAHLAPWCARRLILNVKNHVRTGQVVPVARWHVAALTLLGFTLVNEERVEAPGLRYGANSHLRVDHELVLVFEAPGGGGGEEHER
jgi:hypothetical protein